MSTLTSYAPVIALLGDMAPKNEAQLEAVGDALLRAVIIEAMSRMDARTLDAFDALLERNAGPEILATFLKEQVPDIERVARAEASRLLLLAGNN